MEIKAKYKVNKKEGKIMKKIIMSIVLAIALVVPVVEPGVTEQTEIVQAKSNLGKYVTKKNYKKIKKGMSIEIKIGFTVYD